MTVQMLIVFATLLAFVAMILSGKVKIHVAALCIPIILEITGVLEFKEAWSGMLNSSVVMMASMFIVGAAINKTSLLKKMSNALIKPGASDFRIMVGIMVPILFLGCFVNSTAVMTIMIPMITSICADHKRPVSKFMFPAVLITQCWVGWLPTGGNAGSYLATNTMIENLGGVGNFTYFTTMIAKAPVVVILIPIILYLTVKMAPDLGNIPSSAEVELVAKQNAGKSKAKDSTLSPAKEKLTIVVFILTVIGIVTCALLNISTWYPSTVAAMILVFAGVMDDKEAIRAMCAPVIFISIGTLPLAKALSKTGADALLADKFNTLTGGAPAIVIMGSMYLLVMVLTQFMSNSAASSAFKTLAALIAVQNGYDPRAMLFSVTEGSANCYLLPSGSVPQMMACDAGGYSAKQVFKMGLPIALLRFIIFLVYIPMVFPLGG